MSPEQDRFNVKIDATPSRVILEITETVPTPWWQRLVAKIRGQEPFLFREITEKTEYLSIQSLMEEVSKNKIRREVQRVTGMAVAVIVGLTLMSAGTTTIMTRGADASTIVGGGTAIIFGSISFFTGFNFDSRKNKESLKLEAISKKVGELFPN